MTKWTTLTLKVARGAIGGAPARPPKSREATQVTTTNPGSGGTSAPTPVRITPPTGLSSETKPPWAEASLGGELWAWIGLPLGRGGVGGGRAGWDCTRRLTH